MAAFWRSFSARLPAILAAAAVALGFLGGLPRVQNPQETPLPAMTQVMTVYGTSKSSILQGGCTDGERLYLLFTDGSASDAADRIFVVDPATQTVEQISAALPLDHGNDMTYNPRTGKLMAVHNAPNARLISFLDPRTLTVTKTKKIADKVYGIAYDTLENCYYLGISGTNDFVRYSGSLQREATIPGRQSDAVRQGMEVLNGAVCFLFSAPNRIAKYTAAGDYVGGYLLPVQSGEPECLCQMDDGLYLCYGINGAGSAVIYRLQ